MTCAIYYSCSHHTYDLIYAGLIIIIVLVAAAAGLSIWIPRWQRRRRQGVSVWTGRRK